MAERPSSRSRSRAYVVFGLAKAKQAGFTVDPNVLDRGVRYLTDSLEAPKDLEPWQLNEQAFMLYALAEAGQMEPNRAGALYEAREGLSIYAKAYLALALEPDRRRGRAGAHQDAAGRHQRAGHHQRHLGALGGGVDRLLEHEHRHPHHLDRAGRAGQARPEEQPGAQRRALADERAQGGPLGDHPGERLGHHGADRLDGRHAASSRATTTGRWR